MPESYKLEYTYSSRQDIRNMKEYILKKFKYREYANNFSLRMKKATKSLKNAPYAYGTVGFRYRGYDVRLKSYLRYLIFYIVDDNRHSVLVLRVLQDGMNWESILRLWLKRSARALFFLN